MNIIEKIVGPNEEGRAFLSITVGDETLTFIDGEPEDANLCRDFNDCYNIVNFMYKAYNAGKAGEPFEHEIIQTEDF